MDLQALADATRIPLRKLRYVLDHRLLPGLRVKHSLKSVGHPRTVTRSEGLAIACAAALLTADVRRETIVLLVDALCDKHLKIELPRPHKLPVLDAALYGRLNPATAFVGDGALIRFQLGTCDSGWIEAKTSAKLADFVPRVVVQIDLGQLRDAVLHVPSWGND